MRMAFRSTLAMVAVAAFTGCQSFRDCSDVDASAAEALPGLLSQTGLYDDIDAGDIAPSAIAFVPQFPLWTDGAKKRRWLLLPEGGQVDTRDALDWAFPVGTKTFKEFTRDGVRIETRMNLRTEDGWAAVAYLWNDAGDDAVRQLEPVEDAAGTPHDVPGAAQCLTCHAGRRNFTLGFSATQLPADVRETLHTAGVLSEPVTAEVHLSAEARAGLGVLHGNCSHCHNADRDAQVQATTCYAPDGDEGFDMSLPPSLDALADAPVVQTGAWQLGSTGDSEILHRMTRRNLDEDNPSMPPLGTELVDDAGVDAVEALIAEVAAAGLAGGR